MNLTRSLSHTALDLALPVSMSEEGKSVDSVCVNSARSVMLEDIEVITVVILDFFPYYEEAMSMTMAVHMSMIN